MLNLIKKILFPSTFSFQIVDTDYENNFVTVEDKSLGLTKEIKWGNKELLGSKIVGEYEILFIYQDGSSKVTRILK